MTIEGAISYYEGQAVYAKDHGYPLAGEWNGQIAAWLRELQERRKADSCEGCKNIDLWENEYENELSCPCLRCARRAKDNCEPERRAND